MFVLMTCKQTTDKRGLPCDTLEQNYIDYFKSHPLTPNHAVFLPVANQIENIKMLTNIIKPAFIIFTGGNNLDPKDLNLEIDVGDLAPKRDCVERYLYQFSVQQDIPLLAICRGFQHVNVLSGGKITLNLKNHPIQPHQCLYENKVYQVNSYHDHGIFKGDLSSQLKAIVKDKNSELVEGYIENKRERVLLGIQWHPERPNTDESLFSQLYGDFLKRSGLI